MINIHHLSLTHFIVHAALHLPHSGPALLLLHLRVIVEDLVPQPGQVVDTHLVFLALIDAVGDQLPRRLRLSNYLNAFKLWFGFINICRQYTEELEAKQLKINFI